MKNFSTSISCCWWWLLILRFLFFYGECHKILSTKIITREINKRYRKWIKHHMKLIGAFHRRSRNVIVTIYANRLIFFLWWVFGTVLPVEVSSCLNSSKSRIDQVEPLLEAIPYLRRLKIFPMTHIFILGSNADYGQCDYEHHKVKPFSLYTIPAITPPIIGPTQYTQCPFQRFDVSCRLGYALFKTNIKPHLLWLCILDTKGLFTLQDTDSNPYVLMSTMGTVASGGRSLYRDLKQSLCKMDMFCTVHCRHRVSNSNLSRYLNSCSPVWINHNG